MSGPQWRIWIDRGGTFTDCLGRDPVSGEIRATKLLSSDEAPLQGIRQLLNVPPSAPIPPCDIRMGTTVATNALLQRRGVPCALVVSRGFGDLLTIGDQTRPDLFSLNIERPTTLHDAVLEVDARCDADGNVLSRPNLRELGPRLRALRARDIESLAVVLLHAYREPALEREIGELAQAMGFAHVSLSHEIANEIGMVGRGDTTTVDAYLTPLLRRYLQDLVTALPGSTLRVMQSSGGLSEAGRFRGRDAILSGPAGGVVACGHIADTLRLPQVIGFDMGGTSTDVSRYDGSYDRSYETEVAGVRIRTPMMAIHTVAAGGGSICRYAGGRFTVGPDSVGADPGPLCYGRSGARSIALTDVNLLLGRLAPERFPFPLDLERVEHAFSAITERLQPGSERLGPLEVARGFFEVAVSNMAQAIRTVTMDRGHDARDHAMIVFGGAGGQHACAVARQLGIHTLVLHPYAGVLSALGMGVADVTWHGERDAGRLRLHDSILGELRPGFERLEQEGRAVLRSEGIPPGRQTLQRRVDLRYRGTETVLTLPLCPDAHAQRAAFEQTHRRSFGYVRSDHPIEITTIRLEAVGAQPRPTMPSRPRRKTPPAPLRHTSMWAEGAMQQVPVYQREDLSAGTSVDGPALILEATGTIALDPGWRLTVDDQQNLLVRDMMPSHVSTAVGTRADPINLEIFNNRFMAIAEQMGRVLQRTALSTNIRERRDFSCAVFDADGGLVANAPHIPVHLGAMSESVRSICHAHPHPDPGDVFVTNDPAAGGSHLPDVTVLTPVHHDGAIVFYVASRGHHADIGGITPGSMPPFSRTIHEEGVVLRGLHLVRGGQSKADRIAHVLGQGPHPARDPAQNLADLQAQVAANALGVRLLDELVDHYGVAVVNAYMGHVQANAEHRVADAIEALPNGRRTFEDHLDDGTPIRVVLDIRGPHMQVDFSGTGPQQQQGNFNAPKAVTVAAVLYVLRCLVGRPIPLNSGCLKPITLRIPTGSLLDPDADRAVAAGNVETSQRIVDVLLGALGLAAASQGTMNNLTFGDESFGYYETIGGGAGAGRGYAGASGVHTHMTNTRITDPEVLEARHPVRLHRFTLRAGSGGDGQFSGGDGLVRELEFLRPVRVSILSERRERAPFGLAGGRPGTPGRNVHGDRRLPGKVSLALPAGGRIRIETPGGGGYGEPDG